jgi:hypothetical protein
MTRKVIKVKISKGQFSSLLKRLSLNISSQIKEKFYYTTVKEAPPIIISGSIPNRPNCFYISGSIPIRHNFFYSYFTSDKVKWDYNYKAMQEEAE